MSVPLVYALLYVFVTCACMSQRAQRCPTVPRYPKYCGIVLGGMTLTLVFYAYASVGSKGMSPCMVGAVCTCTCTCTCL